VGKNGNISVGQNNTVDSNYSGSIGRNNIVSAIDSFSSGYGNIITSSQSFAFGWENQIRGSKLSTAFGQSNQNNGEATLINGTYNEVDQNVKYGFVTGSNNRLKGEASNAIGRKLIANNYQTVIGMANEEDAGASFIIGNGSWDASTRSNAMVVQRGSGNVWIKGEVTVGSNNEKLATETFVNEKIIYSTQDIGVGAELSSGTLYVVYEE
jgi:hypothetical protein